MDNRVEMMPRALLLVCFGGLARPADGLGGWTGAKWEFQGQATKPRNSRELPEEESYEPKATEFGG